MIIHKMDVETLLAAVLITLGILLVQRLFDNRPIQIVLHSCTSIGDDMLFRDDEDVEVVEECTSTEEEEEEQDPEPSSGIRAPENSPLQESSSPPDPPHLL